MNALTIDNLAQCFTGAIKNKAKYIGIKVQAENMEGPEVIINPTENFEAKSDYYKRAYNEDLSLKTASGIKIIGFTYGDSYADIQEDFNGR